MQVVEVYTANTTSDDYCKTDNTHGYVIVYAQNYADEQQQDHYLYGQDDDEIVLDFLFYARLQV
jgi:hypothetical protein